MRRTPRALVSEREAAALHGPEVRNTYRSDVSRLAHHVAEVVKLPEARGLIEVQKLNRFHCSLLKNKVVDNHAAVHASGAAASPPRGNTGMWVSLGRRHHFRSKPGGRQWRLRFRVASVVFAKMGPLSMRSFHGKYRMIVRVVHAAQRRCWLCTVALSSRAGTTSFDGIRSPDASLTTSLARCQWQLRFRVRARARTGRWGWLPHNRASGPGSCSSWCKSAGQTSARLCELLKYLTSSYNRRILPTA